MQWITYELAGSSMLKKPQHKQKGANAAMTMIVLRNGLDLKICFNKEGLAECGKTFL